MFPAMWSSLDKKPVSEETIKKIQPFMFCRWLAGNPTTIKDAAIFNTYDKIPTECLYYTIKNKYAGKIRNIKWVKNETDDIDQKLINIMCTHFKVSIEKAKEYLELISDDELNYLIDLYEPRK